MSESEPRSEVPEPAIAGQLDVLNELEAELQRVRKSYTAIEHTPPRLFCVFYLLRGIRGLRIIRMLVKSGLAAEAAMVLRSLLEDVVTVRYVLADFDQRFDKWISHARIREAYYADIALRIGSSNPERNEQIRKRASVLGNIPGGPARDRWDSGFASMARSVSASDPIDGFFEWFEVLYAPLCDVAHGHSGPSIEYLGSAKRDLRDDAPALSYCTGSHRHRARGSVRGLAESRT